MSATLSVADTDSRLIRWLLLCGALAPLMMVAFLIVAGLLTPGYSHVADTVSQLGADGRPHPEVMNAGFIAYGLLINGFAYGLYRQLGRGKGAKAIWVSLGISGAGLLLAGIFHVDPKMLGAPPADSPVTLEGGLHAGFAQVAFLAFAVAIMIFAWTVSLDPAWRGFTGMSLAVVFLYSVVAVMFWSDVAVSIEGALQRSFFGIAVVWVEAVSLRSLRLARGAETR